MSRTEIVAVAALIACGAVGSAQQQAPAIAANAQRQMEKGSWMTFAVMSITLLVAIIGAKAGIPNFHYRSRLVFRP